MILFIIAPINKFRYRQQGRIEINRSDNRESGTVTRAEGVHDLPLRMIAEEATIDLPPR
jgi:hypothetical protein